MSKNKKHRNNGVHGHDRKGNDPMLNEQYNNDNPAEETAQQVDQMVEGEDEPQILDNFDAVEDGDETAESGEDSPAEDTAEEEPTPEKQIEELKSQLEKEKKEYLFLMAEFDNFRKRTLKEKSEIIKNAGEKVFKGLLPIVDDMERGIKASENATDVQTVRDGLILIYNKLVKFMEANGVKAYDEGDDTFDADRHEAITAVPVQDESQKGKILDTIEKGYTINDKVLRHARVVVGQ